MAETESKKKDRSRIDLAALYATLILIIGTVISEWPPEGQESWFPNVFSDILFIFSGIATTLIVLRILLLIWNADPLFEG